MPSSINASVSRGVAWPRMLRGLSFAVVHFAGFFWKAVAHVFGVGHHMANHFEQGGLQLRGL